MLEQYQQYWPVLVVLLLAIVAALFLARRGKHVAIDSEPSIRPTLSRERAAVPPATDVIPEAKPEVRIEPVAGTPDNLTAIKGLGPRIQTMLNGFGITRFEQIARLTPEEQISLDQNMGPFKGRMAQDRWVEQAAILASGDRAAFESEFGKITGG
jgi:predicted flap endonuclease-1-like 5' DNA nuclease